MDKYDRRYRVLSEIEAGRLDPEEGERILRKRKIAPLNPPARFDPLQKSRWTLFMAIAWISTRDLKQVREVSPDYRKRQKLWYPQFDGDAFSGYVLLSIGPAYIVHLHFLETLGKAEIGSIDEAIAALWEALAAGRLVASGIDANGSVNKVPEYMWEHLTFAQPAEGEREALAIGSPEGRIVFREATVAQTEIFREFGPALDTIPQSRKRKMYPREVLAEVLRLHFPKGFPPDLSVKERDDLIWERSRPRLAKRPNPVTFRRAMDEATKRQTD